MTFATIFIPKELEGDPKLLESLRQIEKGFEKFGDLKVRYDEPPALTATEESVAADIAKLKKALENFTEVIEISMRHSISGPVAQIVYSGEPSSELISAILNSQPAAVSIVKAGESL